MNGPGLNIGKALRRFTARVFPTVLGLSRPLTRADAEWCLWMDTSYPRTLEALAKLPEFAGNEKMADAYICGYYRGLKMAAFELTRKHKSKRKRR